MDNQISLFRISKSCSKKLNKVKINHQFIIFSVFIIFWVLREIKKIYKTNPSNRIRIELKELCHSGDHKKLNKDISMSPVKKLILELFKLKIIFLSFMNNKKSPIEEINNINL